MSQPAGEALREFKAGETLLLGGIALYSRKQTNRNCKNTRQMNNSEKNNLLKWNTILWLAAMTVPPVLSLAFASTKFPWQIISPLLLFGCLLASNKMLAQAIGPSTDGTKPKSTSV